ncbi:hypothetical protein QTN25_010197 [Entamoeba marina]
MKGVNGKNKTLDLLAMVKVSKFLQSTNDFINVIRVCKKFETVTLNLSFNPIPITSLKLFPNIKSQYLYSDNDTIIKSVGKYDVWFDTSLYSLVLETFKNVLKVQSNDLLLGSEEVYNIFNYGNATYHRYLINAKGVIATKNSVDDQIILDIDFSKVDEEVRDDLTCRHFGEFLDFLTHEERKLYFQYYGEKNPSASEDDVVLDADDDDFAYLHPREAHDIAVERFKQQSEFINQLQSGKIPKNVIELRHLKNLMNGVETLEVPHSVSKLGEGCFKNSSRIKEIKLPEMITNIPSKCFSKCYSLSSISLPPYLTSIQHYAFDSCLSLQSITIPSSVVEIDENAFCKCNRLTSIELPSKLQHLKNKIMDSAQEQFNMWM